MPYSRTLATLVLVGAIAIGACAIHDLATGVRAIARGTPVHADWILRY